MGTIKKMSPVTEAAWRPEPPIGVAGWALRILGGVIILFVLAFVGYCAYWNISDGPSKEFKAEIEEDLGPGASIEDIEGYLLTEGQDKDLRYTTDIRTVKRNSDVAGLGVPVDTPYIQATQGDGLGGFDVFFILDDQMLLQRVIVRAQPKFGGP